MNMESDPRIQGHINEERFFAILETRLLEGQFPEWLYSYRKALWYEDQLGVDGFVKIYNLAGYLTAVPFQVKSSSDGIIRLYQRHKVHWMDNLRCFIVNPEMPDDTI